MTDDRLEDGKLRELARRLGAAPAQRLDVERVAQAVVERLRTEPAHEARAPSPWWVQPGWMRAAAAVVLMLGVGLVARARLPLPGSHPTHYVAEELDDLTADELRDVLGTLDQTLDGTAPVRSDEDLTDMTTEQLQALLQSLEP